MKLIEVKRRSAARRRAKPDFDSEISGEEFEGREITTEVAAIEGGEAFGLEAGVGGDEEIGEQMLSGSAFPPIAKEGLARKVG